MKKEKIHIRIANLSEIDWINSKYKESNLTPSNFSDELIVIAEINNEKCGLGRLRMIDNKNLELGGINVFKEFRGKGIAGKILSFLDKNKDLCQQNITWSLVPDKLLDFHKKYGFQVYKNKKIKVPEEIKKKYNWASNHYNTSITLIVKKS